MYQRLVYMITVLAAVAITEDHGAKILLHPGPLPSHCMEMLSVGRELLERGHHVTLLAHILDPTSCLRVLDGEEFDKFKIISTQIDPKVSREILSFTEMGQSLVLKQASLFTLLAAVSEGLFNGLCTSMFHDKKAVKELEDDQYDIVIVDGSFIAGCVCALPIHLEVPYAVSASFITPRLSSMPLQTITFPNIFSDYTNEMNFLERLINSFFYFITPIFYLMIEANLDLSEYSDKLKGIDTRNLFQQANLFIENGDYVIDYPKAVFPNFVQVGGLTVRSPKPLPSDLQKFLDEAKYGVVLFSLGSFLNEIPDSIFDNALNALKRLKQRVILKSNRDAVNGNIKLMNWVPQNDVLAHPNVKVFISHCGKNGFWESVYNSVPIICVPIGVDTTSTAVKVKHHGIGSSFNLFEASSDEIYKVVSDVLSNDTIVRNLQRIVAILKSRPETPGQRAASAVEHVIKYGGSHMKAPSFNMRFTTLIYAEVWIPLIGVAVLIIYINVWLIRKCCCRRRSDKRKTD